MNARRLLLKIYGEKNGDQWSLVCLDFSLAAQGSSHAEAKAILESQIREYLVDAIGEDREHAPELLSRRAPMIYWIKWWIGYVCKKLGGTPRGSEAFREAMPLRPA